MSELALTLSAGFLVRLGEGGLAVFGILALVLGGYLALLALLARPGRTPPAGRGLTRFDLVVPAHDEAPNLGPTLASLETLDYPRDRRRLVVIADNCSDDTAAVARRAGAMVLTRVDPARPGKGQALAFAFARLLDDGLADALVVVDADTVVTPNLLRAFDARIAAGATALQADYGVANPLESWRTRLLTLAFALFHGVRSLGRARLGLSAGLRGNGMCFTTGALRAVPHDAGSIVEDLEQGIALGLAGIRVTYVPEARVLGEMPAGPAAAAGQRRRWEGGRRALVRRHLGPLLRAAWRRRSLVALDLGLDSLVPPLADLVGLVALGLMASLGLHLAGGTPTVAVVAFAGAALAIGVYLARGLAISGLGVRGLMALATAPAYLAWKLVLRRGRYARAAAPWVRTPRKGER